MGPTTQFAEFIANHNYEKLSTADVTKIKQAIMDCVGVSLAGSVEQPVRIAAELVREWGGTTQVRVIGQGFNTNVINAAFVWGIAAHVLDLDDVILSMVGHPSVVLVPVLFSLGTDLGSSGKAIIDAYAVGLETAGKLGRAMFSHYDIGWHATATLGTLAAAAAACRLLELNVDKTQMALGIAASQAAGLRQNFGTMTKSFHAGNAARSGIEAALLAWRGFTADLNILETQFGFLNVFCGAGKYVPLTLDMLGRPYEVQDPGIIFKKYPCCAQTHRAIDAIFKLIKDHDLQPKDVAAVDCFVSDYVTQALIHSNPTSGLQGKFSLQYCMAASLVYRHIGIDTFIEQKVNDPTVQEIMKCVKVTINPKILRRDEEQARVTVNSILGQNYSCTIDFPKGTPQNPMSAEELKSKFLECAGIVLDGKQATSLVTQMETLEDVRNVATIVNQIS